MWNVMEIHPSISQIDSSHCGLSTGHELVGAIAFYLA